MCDSLIAAYVVSGSVSESHINCAYLRMSDLAALNAIAVLKDERPPAIVNPEVLGSQKFDFATTTFLFVRI